MTEKMDNPEKMDVPESESESGQEQGLIGKWKGRLKRSMSAMSQNFEEIEQQKESCDRENIAKHGKDWVNRCCG